jgi:hypothetical protein
MPAATRGSEISAPLLWVSILAGGLAWTLHLLVSYLLVPVACATGRAWLLHGVTLVTEVVTVIGLVIAYRAWKKIESSDRSQVLGRSSGYKRFLALCGVLLNLFFVVVIFLEGLPVAFLSPCW